MQSQAKIRGDLRGSGTALPPLAPHVIETGLARCFPIPGRRRLPGKRRFLGALSLLGVSLGLVTAPFSVSAQPPEGDPTKLHSRAFTPVQRTNLETAYHEAMATVAQTNSVVNLWRLGRAAYDHAETLTREKAKAQVAETGIAACRKAIRENPARAEAHYYLALCLGELAQTKMLGALRLVREIAEEFERVRVLDETFDFAGADRGLGLLYLEAPGWPTSIGDRKKARSHLERAVALSPKYPENRLALLDLQIRTKDSRGAAVELATLNSLWAEMRQTLGGDAWTTAWPDWERQKQELTAKLGHPNGKK